MLSRFFKDRRSAALFFLMFGIVCLLNINYNILRSARNALAVVDLGQGAGSIPFFELCGTMPGSVLMVYLLTRLLNRFSIHKVFMITLAVFSGFFLFFAIGIYPFLSGWGSLVSQLGSMIFFVMAELWKIALLTVLFWGLVNQYIPIAEAKKFYAPLMLGGSVGTILAGPIVSLCTSDWLSQHSWSRSLSLMMIMLALFGVLTGWFYSQLFRKFAGPKREVDSTPSESLSVWESIQVCLRSRYLMLLAWLTIAVYVAYSLGEVIFLDVLKQKFPDPRAYCDFMGQLTFWNGVLTAVSALLVTPYILRRCRWVVAALVTPICILLTEGAFFGVLWNPSMENQLNWLVIFGTLSFCLARAAKYTLFDTSKELVFIPLPAKEKMQGKLIIDGMCSRIGRGGASMISIAFIQLCGGVLASGSIVGSLVLVISLSCVLSTSKLGRLVEINKLGTNK